MKRRKSDFWARRALFDHHKTIAEETSPQFCTHLATSLVYVACNNNKHETFIKKDSSTFAISVEKRQSKRRCSLQKSDWHFRFFNRFVSVAFFMTKKTRPSAVKRRQLKFIVASNFFWPTFFWVLLSASGFYLHIDNTINKPKYIFINTNEKQKFLFNSKLLNCGCRLAIICRFYFIFWNAWMWLMARAASPCFSWCTENTVYYKNNWI